MPLEYGSGITLDIEFVSNISSFGEFIAAKPVMITRQHIWYFHKMCHSLQAAIIRLKDEASIVFTDQAPQ